ncbi:MAG: M50 family metallopeptidase [Polyangiaceae bacterium]|nr:M50 family metallopeptidase [Polyangiaceae bacterium]MBK8940251.1 M50 family metallopeptidase [Polyangiaceae bacterium]
MAQPVEGMRGTWTIGRFRGAPIALHWSLPLGALFFGRFGWVPGFWLAFALVILVHELGHALVVRLTGNTVVHVLVHGLGGECRWDGDPTRLERACIAWGGVWAQLVLAAVAFTLLLIAPPSSLFTAELLHGLTWSNLFLAAFNLIPIPPFDGAEAWKLPGLLRERWRKRRLKTARHTPTPAMRPAPTVKVLPFPKKVDRAEAFPVEDEGPLSAEARRIVQEAAEIAKRAAREEAEKKRR